jgi:uncharacterized membrane protein YbaN (DUF454 family)
MIRLLGFVFLALALVGVFLPLLPTTPFVLLAAACFAQSSERMHRWILANETFGPMVRDWEQKRCVSCRVKIIAIASMAVVGGVSVFLALDSAAWRLAGAALLLTGSLVVLNLKTCGAREEAG